MLPELCAHPFHALCGITFIIYRNNMATITASSQQRSLSIAAIIMMGSVLLSRIIGLAREIILARYGGTTIAMDAYVTSFFIPELLNHFLASGFLSITFIPIFQQYIARKRITEGWQSFSNLLCIGSLLFLIVIPAIMIFTPQLLLSMGPHINNPETSHLTTRLTRIILPAQIFFYWGAFFNAVQMAHQRFFLTALTPLIYNAGIIAGGIFLGPSIGIEGFAWGVLAGSFIGNVAVPLFGALSLGMRFSFNFNIKHPDVKTYIVKTLPLILGVSMSFSTEIFFRYFGSFLSEGGTSSVNYALRTMMIVVGVFGQASGVAFFPFLSQLAAENKFDEMTRLLNTLLHKIAMYLVPVSAILYFTARPLIQLLYERGKFSHDSTLATASVFCIYIFGSFAFSASIIVSRSFYALQNMLTPLITSSAIALGSIPLYLIFSNAAGARGMAFAAVIGMFLQFIILYILWNRKFGSFKTVATELVFLVKISLISVCAAAASRAGGTLILQHVPQLSSVYYLHIGVSIAIVAIPALCIIFIVYEVTGIQKLRDSLHGLLKRK